MENHYQLPSGTKDLMQPNFIALVQIKLCFFKVYDNFRQGNLGNRKLPLGCLTLRRVGLGRECTGKKMEKRDM